MVFMKFIYLCIMQTSDRDISDNNAPVPGDSQLPPRGADSGTLVSAGQFSGSGAPMSIDLDAVLRKRAPRLRRRMPRWLVRRLEKIICQDEMNEMLRVAGGRRGSAFCRSVLDHLKIDVTVKGLDLLPPVSDTNVLFICNHPLGGLDGIALIDFVASRYGVEPLFVVNDLLMAIEPLRDVFVPINKHGSQSRASARAVDEAFASARPLIIFPAGLVSRRQRHGVIADMQWQKMFIAKARACSRTIIPLYFSGRNSSFFYKFAKFRASLGLKFNIEMVRLPREVFRAAGSHFDILIGNPVAPGDIMLPGESMRDAADRLRNQVYDLPNHYNLSTSNASADN